MKKVLFFTTALFGLAVAGCSGGSSDEAPAVNGNKPEVSAPPPGMTGPGQRAGGPQSELDKGEGSR